MSSWKKITCGILAVVLLGIGVGAFVLRDELCALFTGLRYSQEELEQKLEQNEQTIRDAAQAVPDFTVRDLTEEEKQGLKDGTLTAEELIESLVQPTQSGQASEEGEPSGVPTSKPEQTQPGSEEQVPTQTQSKPGTQQPALPQQKPEAQEPTQPQTGTKPPQVSDYQKQLASIIAEVYVLRQEFLIKLDDLLAQAKAEYVSIPAKERSAKLSSLAGKYFSKAYSLEAECDSRMRGIIDRMETLLKENGGDLSIAQSVMDTYLSEKSLKKSWYLAELKKRGI